jgi:hypothetical protein
MNKIHNLETLLLEKQRLYYECLLKEEKLKHSLEHLKDEAPKLIKHAFLTDQLNLPGILKMIGGLLLKPGTSEIISTNASATLSTAEMVLAKTLFRIANKVFAKKKTHEHKPTEHKSAEHKH